MIRRTIAALLLSSLPAIPVFGATITVTGTGDLIAADGACTLREAITAANTNAAVNECTAGTAGLDTIAFNIGSGGAQTINVTSSLPSITEAVTIDGSTQPGFTANPLITILGSAGAAGLSVIETAGGSTIRSLALGGFQNAITLRSANNLVTGNYIGLTAAGTVAANSEGIDILAPSSASNSTGNTLTKNVIAGSTAHGILVADASLGGSADNNLIQQNVFGVSGPFNFNAKGIELQNVSGTQVLDNQIGRSGTGLTLTNSTSTVVQGNTFGGSGQSDGDGIYIDGTSNNNIIGASTSGGSGGNTISFNNGRGITVLGTGNRILTNSIFQNITIGIDLFPLGPSPNDACDADTGGNQLQNFPVITSAIADATQTVITGTLNSTPSSTFTLEFFRSLGVEPQGELYLGNGSVTTNASCTGSFTVTLPTGAAIGDPITATATNSGHNTSEFATVTTTVIGALQVAKSFTPASILRNTETSKLSVTVSVQSGTQSNISFTDNLPANVVIAANPAASNTCSGTVTAVPGSGSFSFSGGFVNSNTPSCTIDVDVIGTVAGNYTNTLPAGSVTSAQSSRNLTAASSPLQVTELPAPAVTKSFTPAGILPGGTTQLTITLTNSSTTAISGVQFTDSYPTGLENAAAPSTTCGGTVTAPLGGSTLALSGGTIPASGSCTVSVTVRAPNGGSFTNTLPAGSVTSANSAPSGGAATAALVVAPIIPTTSEWGLLLILCALGAIAAIRLR